jgi:hypothetical protein
MHHYGHEQPTAWVQRFHDAPPKVHSLLRLDLRSVGRTPRLTAALDALLQGARRAGLDAADTWGCATGAQLLDHHPRVLDLHRAAFFGASQPMISLGPTEQAALAASDLDAATLLDVRLAGHVVHELAHGPDRGWTGGPASWLLHEAAAAIVNWGCQPDHVLPARPGEPVLGLAASAVVGAALVEALGVDGVWRLALSARSADAGLGAMAGAALTAAEWQGWARRGRGPFRPWHDRVVSFARLIDVATSAPHLLPPGLADLDPVASVGPAAALALPDLLDAADAISADRLPAWHRPLRDADRDAVHLAVASLFRVERLQPDLQVCAADPPGGELHLDVDAATLSARARAEDALPVQARLPLPLCAGLRAAGHRQLTLPRCTWEDRAALADRLLDLATGRKPRPTPAPPLVAPTAPAAQLHHADPVVTLGSCFAASLAERLADGGFEVHANPFGILYDPLSVARAMDWLDRDDPLPDDLLFRAHGRWHSPWHHTDLSHPDRDHALAVMRQRLADARASRSSSARRATWLLTWGTSWVWRRDGVPVANCHGLDGYDGAPLTVDAIVAAWSPLLDRLAADRPTLRLVLTISPIRHLAQGPVVNTRSKAVLHLAAAALAERHANLTVFPAYELVLDELRDHRWFEADGAHVTPAAADVVAERFFDTFLAPHARARARALRDAHRRLVATPRDPLRRRDALDAVLADLDALPVSPTTPPPRQLRVQVALARAAAAAMLDDDPPPAATRDDDGPPHDSAATAPPLAPFTQTARDPDPTDAGPASARDPAGSAGDDPLATLVAALAPGRWIDWEALPDWVAAVRAAAAAVRGPDAWAALDAALAKSDELEDPSCLADVTAPLLRALWSPARPADAVHALAERLRAALPRGLITPSDLAAVPPEDRGALADLLGNGRPHPAVDEALSVLRRP